MMEGREAVASLCGLVLRRLQDGEEGAPLGGAVTFEDLRRIFGEALQQFSDDDE